MQLRYELNPADIHLWYRHQVATSPQWIAAYRSFKKTRVIMTIACPAAAALVLYLLHRHGNTSVDASPIPLVISCSALVYFLWWSLSAWQVRWPSYIESAVTQLERSVSVATLTGAHEIELAPDQFRFVAPRHTVLQQWAEITRIHDAPGHIFIVRADTLCYIVPKRAFNAASEIAAFLAAAGAHHKATGHDPDTIASRLLAARDFPCPACRYNLRGSPSATCPECAAFILPALES